MQYIHKVASFHVHDSLQQATPETNNFARQTSASKQVGKLTIPWFSCSEDARAFYWVEQEAVSKIR